MTMTAAFALDVPRGVSMTAHVKGGNGGVAMPPSTVAKLGALPPCEDAEVQLPEPCLLMTGSELGVIEAKAAALAEAQAALVGSEQALARAQALARQIPHLRQMAGVAAAAGFSGRKADAEGARRAVAELAEAERAASAVPALEDEQREAKNRAALALGALKGNAQTSIRNALVRQAREYERLAREQVRVVAHLLAAVELLNDRDLLADTHGMFLPDLRVPAAPGPLVSDHNAVAEMAYRPTLLAYEHPRLTAMQKAAHGWLVQQLQAAAGLPPQRLMRG